MKTPYWRGCIHNIAACKYVAAAPRPSRVDGLICFPCTGQRTLRCYPIHWRATAGSFFSLVGEKQSSRPKQGPSRYHPYADRHPKPNQYHTYSPAADPLYFLFLSASSNHTSISAARREARREIHRSVALPALALPLALTTAYDAAQELEETLPMESRMRAAGRLQGHLDLLPSLHGAPSSLSHFATLLFPHDATLTCWILA
jgi:hypothetical protein